MDDPAVTRPADVEQLASLFKMLSDPTRLNILMMLAQGERNVSAICAALDLPQPTVSHHLGLLRMSNIIGNRRAGKQMFYALNGSLDALASGEVALNTGRLSVRIQPNQMPS